jgi:hypothetical protein
MDDRLIYTKTAAGELAMRERTRLIQRNLRMVLILVEGQTTVAALKEKVADDSIVESALVELEQMGLIEPQVQGKRKLKAAESADEDITGPLVGDEEKPVWVEPQLPLPQSGIPTQPPREYAALFDVDKAAKEAPAPGGEGDGRVISADDVLSGARSESVAKNGRQPWQLANMDVQDAFEKIRQSRLFHMPDREEREFERAYRDDTRPTPVKIKRVKKGQQTLLIWPFRILLALLGVVVALAAVAALFPFDRYRPQIEAAAARALRSPVKIESVRFAFTPYPNLTLERVVVGGAAPYAWIERVRMVPDPLSVFADTPVIRNLQIESMRLGVFGLDRCSRWLSTASDDFLLRRLTIDNLGIDLGSGSMNGWSAEAVLRPQGSLAKVSLSSADGNFRVEAEPQGNLYRLSISGSNWAVPMRPGLNVSAIEAKGELTAQQLRMPKFVAEMHDGLVEGSGTFDWSDGASLVGDVELKHSNMGRLSAIFDPDLSVEGEVSGRARLEARARNAAGLLDALHLDGSFTITHVILNHFDFVEAVRTAGREPVRSGSTRVDQLDGKLQCDDSVCRATGVKMSSGLMRADGRLSVARKDRKLDGTINVELRGSANNVNAPIGIGGTLERPELRRR